MRVSPSIAYARDSAWHASCDRTFVMKNQTLAATVVGIVLVAAWAAPAMVHAEKSFDAGIVTIAAESGRILSGKIAEKSDVGITVAGQALVVNSATAITKDGAKAKLEELKVGDHVKVITGKTADGKIVALSIEVASAI